MNEAGTRRLPPPQLFGNFDREGRLLDGVAELVDWHQRSGGSDGQAIALPGVADLIRQTAETGVPMTHSFLLANKDHTATYWARTVIQDEQVRLELVDSSQVVEPERSPEDVLRQRDFTRAGCDWLWEVDAESRLTALSDSAAIFFGCPARTLVGRHFVELLHEHQAVQLDRLAATLRSGRAFRDFKVGLEPRRTRHRALLLHAEPVGQNGAATGRLRGSATEVDLPAPVEKETPSPAALSSPAIGEILRMPVDAIMAEAEVLREQALGPLRSGYVGYANDIAFAAHHLRGLVDNLFDVAKIDSGTLALKITKLDLAQVTRRAISITQARALARGKDLTAVGVSKCQVLGDPQRIVQILVNLIDNAIKYSDGGHRIAVSLECLKDRVHLHVDDDGPGIPPYERQRIFAKFERLDPTAPEGTGLGLYIARELARTMNGELICSEAPIGGARFTLELRAGL